MTMAIIVAIIVVVLSVVVTPIVFAKKKMDQMPVHKDLQACFNCRTAFQMTLECLERHFSDANQGFQMNRGWIMKHAPCTLGFELGVYFNDAEMVERFAVMSDIKKDEAIFELCSYCDRPDVRKALEMLGPSNSDNGYVFRSMYAGKLFAKRDKELLMFVQKLLPKINVSDPNQSNRGIHVDYNFGSCSNSYWTLLSKAVDDDDVGLVSFLLDLGADPNVYLSSYWNMNKGSSFISEPVLEHIKSQEVFNVMAKAGMNLYPKCGRDEEIKNGKGQEVFLSEKQRAWRLDWESKKLARV